MADLGINFAGIRSPNPFWLASAPPSNSGLQVHRAFEAGWGGAVWKTIGAPVLNVSNRYGAWHYGGQKMLAINNVELISDRPLEVNLREIAEVKRAWPDRAVIVSAMVESKPETWHDIIRRIQDTGADGIELNYGCPHGMSERGMGSAVGQVPEYCEQITRWVMEVAKIPVIVKLTPNISDIVMPARAAVAAGANAISLINTLNSIIGVDLETLEITPNIAREGRPRRLRGPGREANRAEYAVGAGKGPDRQWVEAADFGDGRNFHVARRGRISAARRQQSAGVHRGDALWLPHRGRFVRRAVQLDGRERLHDESLTWLDKACIAYRTSIVSTFRFAP